METKQTHFKMYKDGRKWVFACALVLALGGTATVAHADATATSDTSSSSTVVAPAADTSTAGKVQTETDEETQPSSADKTGDAANQQLTNQNTQNKETDTNDTNGQDVNNASHDSENGTSENTQQPKQNDSTTPNSTLNQDPATNRRASGISAESLPLDATTPSAASTVTDQNQRTAQQATAQQTATRADNPQVQDGLTADQDFNIDAENINLLGVSSYFHIFSNEATLQAHVNGNVAVGLLHGEVNFGTNIIEALLDKDISYIQDFDKMANSSFVFGEGGRCNKVIFGNGLTLDVSNPDRPVVNGIAMDHLTLSELYQDKGSNVYIDFAKEFAFLREQNQTLTTWTSTQDYTNADFPDRNQRVIDITDMQPDENGRIVLNLSPDVLQMDTPLTIKGLDPDEDGTTVIINVDTGGQNDYNVKSPIKIIYSDGSERNSHETEYFGDNHLLWNFVDQSAEDKQFSGNLDFNAVFQGSVLAPSADITVHQNLDGNIIGNKVTIKAETHRWDLQDRPNPEKPTIPIVPLPGIDVEMPEEPEPETPEEPEPEPETPEPETPEPETPEPETPEPETPGTEEPEPEKPGTEEPEKPGTVTPEVPGTEEPEAPETEAPGEEGNEVDTSYEHQHVDNEEIVEFQDELGDAVTTKEQQALLVKIEAAIAQAKAAGDSYLVAQLEAIQAQLMKELGYSYGNGAGLPQTSEAHSTWMQVLGLALAGTTLGGWLLARKRRN